MRKVVLAVILVSSIVFCEILDPSFGSMRVLSSGWKGIFWNVAGLAGANRMIYADVVYRFSGGRDEKGLNIAYLSGENDSGLTGAVGFYRYFTYTKERIGAYYAVSGSLEADWGIGVGVERIRDEIDPEGVLSLFVDLGARLRYSPLEFAISLRKLRLYSQRMTEYLVGDLGVGIGLDFGPVEIGGNALVYNANILRLVGGMEFEIGPVSVGLGGGIVSDLQTLNYTPRFEGSVAFSIQNLGFGVYLGSNAGEIDVQDLYEEVELGTVVSGFFSFSW